MGVVPLGLVDKEEFAYMANHYRLEGMTPILLCQWNRDVAAMCNRIDDARAWDFLIGLVDEFGTTNEGMFNESVFSQAATIVPPRPPSPHGLETRRQSDETINAGAFPGLPLLRGEDITAPETERGDDDSGSSKSDGPQTPTKSRFKSFVMPTANDTQRPNIPRWASSGSTLLATNAIMRGGKKLGFETPLSDEDESLTPIANMDFPDPYGISAALESASSVPWKPMAAGRSSRSSRSTPQSTRPPSPNRVGSSIANGRRSVTGSARGSQRPSVTDRTLDRIQPSLLTRRVQDAFPPSQWDEYRDARTQSFLDWWQAYVDDVSCRV